MNVPLRRAILVACGLTGLYAAAGTLWAPRLVRKAVMTYVSDHGYTASVGAITINPFTLDLNVSSLLVAKSDNAPVLSVGHLHAQLSWRILLGRGTPLRDLDIAIESARLTLRPDGTVDLMDLVPAADPTTPWPLVSLDRGHLTAQRIQYVHSSVDPGLNVTLGNLLIDTRDFSTAATTTDWHLAVATDRGESATANVALRLTPMEVRGSVQVSQVDLARFSKPGDAERPHLGGKANATAQISWTSGGAVKITDAHIDGSALALALPPAQGPVLAVDAWAIERFSYDSGAGRVILDGVSATAPRLHLTHTEHGWIGLATESSASAVNVSYGALRIEGGEIEIDERAAPKPVTLKATEVTANIGALTTAGRTLTAQASIGPSGTIMADGEIGSDATATVLNLKASKISLLPYRPYLEPLIALTVDSGIVSTEGRLEQVTDGWHFSGSAALDNVRTHDRAGQHDLLGVRHLQVDNLDALWPAMKVHAGTILAEDPYADVRIGANGEVNISSLVPEDSKSTESSAPDLSVDLTRVAHGRVFFSDESQNPTFDAGIADLEGEIRGLSSDPTTQAHVSFSGHVDRYAPVSIEGTANLIGNPISADIRMRFENLELTGLSPYSGRFAGYRIRKGKATADLSYHVANRHVDATHHVRLKQFELGDKVEGQAGFGVPLGLVVALLKDKDGNIDLDVPLSGSFSDPDFHLGRMTRKVVGNLFRKVATAPFALLGALFGAGEEIALVEFPAGSVELDSVARERLATVTRAMTARPQINIEIPIVTTEADASTLASTRLEGVVLTRARELFGDLGNDALSARLRDSADDRRAVMALVLGIDAKTSTLTVDQMDAQARQHTTATPEDLEQLSSARAESVQAALLEGSGLDPGRVFLVRGGKAETKNGRTQLKLGLR